MTTIAILLPVLIFAGCIVTTKGQGNEEACTKLGRFCVSPAVCDRQNKQCLCPAGTFGSGLMDCVTDGYSNCMVVEDPKITQFPGSKGALYLPCRKRLAKFSVPVVDSPLFCQFTVYGLSELASNGRVFENEVEIELSLGTLQPPTGTFVANNTIYFRANVEGAQWTTSKNGWMSNANTYTRTPWQKDVTVTFGNITINITFDSDNIMTWRAQACDTTIKFRPFDPREMPQTRVPGICITAPPRARFDDPQCKFPNVLCATPTDSSTFLGDAANSLGLSVDEYLLFAALRYAPKQSRGPYKFECSLVCNMFKWKCSREKQVQAIQTCSFLLTRRKTLSCIQGSQTSYNVMNIFQKCVQFVCLNDYFSCQALIKLAKKCQKEMKLDNLDCGSSPFHQVV